MCRGTKNRASPSIQKVKCVVGYNQRAIFHTGLASVGLRKSRQPPLVTASGVKRSQRPNRLRCPEISSKSPAPSALKQGLANENPLFQGGWQVDAIPLNRHVAHQTKRIEWILLAFTA